MRSVAEYFEHVTLTTGDRRRSPRSEVADQVIEGLQPMIEAIEQAGAETPMIPLPGVPGYSVSGRADSRCLVATVYADGPPSELLASIGIALHSRCGASLWRNLHQWGQLGVVTDPEAPPPEPWVAAALDEGAPNHVEAMEVLGDFERCLAWAFLERRRG